MSGTLVAGRNKMQNKISSNVKKKKRKKKKERKLLMNKQMPRLGNLMRQQATERVLMTRSSQIQYHAILDIDQWGTTINE